MSKIVAFSDLHGHPFKAYATLLPNGRNSRLNDAVCVVQQVRDHALAIGADLVVFAGDMFHVRKNIPVTAFNLIYEELSRFPVMGLPTVMLHGNHDQADRFGEEYSVFAFGAFCTVFDKAGWLSVDTPSKRERIGILGVPYTEDLDHLRSVSAQLAPSDVDHKIFLGHFGIQGAKLGADFVYVNRYDATLKDFHSDQFDAVLMGHYHLHQQLAPNAWYIGAPLQHNWGDKNQRRGFVIYDTETRTVEHVPLIAPEFVELTEQQLEEREYDTIGDYICTPDSYVRLISDHIWSVPDQEKLKKQLEARSLEIIKPARKVSGQQPRLAVDPTMDAREVIDKYVHAGVVTTDGLDENFLIQLAHEIMQEVEERQ
jgi:DNA repair exonuclease SbcCD nuclease subunit